METKNSNLSGLLGRIKRDYAHELFLKAEPPRGLGHYLQQVFSHYGKKAAEKLNIRGETENDELINASENQGEYIGSSLEQE